MVVVLPAPFTPINIIFVGLFFETKISFFSKVNISLIDFSRTSFISLDFEFLISSIIFSTTEYAIFELINSSSN